MYVCAATPFIYFSTVDVEKSLRSRGVFGIQAQVFFMKGFTRMVALLPGLVSVLYAQDTPPIRYRNPLVAMSDRYAQPVNIRILPAWKLTEQQMQIAAQPPRLVPDARRIRYAYPEDTEPTAEQVATGAALTPKQRKSMSRARRAAMREAVWRAGIEAEVHNRSHSETLAAQENQGRHIIIKLGEQKGYLMESDKELRAFKICSGKASTPTPKGHFHVQEKQAEHRSNLYNNANMPFFMRLTLDGVGLHQGPIRKKPSSHGCIRLPHEDARYLFEQCAVGTAVFIVD